MKLTCDNCTWSMPNGDGAHQCRRDPPRVVVVQGMAVTLFPTVKTTEWCSKHSEFASIPVE